MPCTEASQYVDCLGCTFYSDFVCYVHLKVIDCNGKSPVFRNVGLITPVSMTALFGSLSISAAYLSQYYSISYVFHFIFYALTDLGCQLISGVHPPNTAHLFKTDTGFWGHKRNMLPLRFPDDNADYRDVQMSISPMCTWILYAMCYTILGTAHTYRPVFIHQIQPWPVCACVLCAKERGEGGRAREQ
jgi:hypothetical protein